MKLSKQHVSNTLETCWKSVYFCEGSAQARNTPNSLTPSLEAEFKENSNVTCFKCIRNMLASEMCISSSFQSPLSPRALPPWPRKIRQLHNVSTSILLRRSNSASLSKIRPRGPPHRRPRWVSIACGVRQCCRQAHSDIFPQDVMQSFLQQKSVMSVLTRFYCF